MKRISWALSCAALAGGCVDSIDTTANQGSLTCSASVEAACSPCSCVATWPTDPVRALCALDPGSSVGTNTSCGGYQLLVSQGTSASTHFYYDSQSGALVAITRTDATTMARSCVAGPSGFSEPPCEYGLTPCADAGVGGASSADAAAPGGSGRGGCGG